MERKIKEVRKREKAFSEDFFALITDKTPSRYTGYRLLIPEKVYQIVRFFAETLQPWKTKLNKLLFYADFLHYKTYGTSISGLKYVAIDHGPVPDNYEILLASGQKRDIFDILFQEAGKDFIGEKIIPSPQQKFNPELFQKEEPESMKTVADRFRNTTPAELVKITYREKAWQENIEKKSIIDFIYGFELLFT